MNYYTYCNKKDEDILDISITKEQFFRLLEYLEIKFNKPITSVKKIYKNNGIVMDFESTTINRVYSINSIFIGFVKNKENLFLKNKRETKLYTVEEFNIFKEIDEEYMLKQYIFKINCNNCIICNIKTKGNNKIYFLELESTNDSILDNIDIL